MKKILAFFTGCVVAVSAFTFTAFAESEDINLTYGSSSSGENWSYDGKTLTLEGGGFDYQRQNSDLMWEIVLNGDCKVGNVSAIFSEYSYPLKMSITSDQNYTLDLSSLTGSGCNYDVFTADGVSLNAGSLAIGASGYADSNLVLKNGSHVKFSSKMGMQIFSLSENSFLEIDGGLELVPIYYYDNNIETTICMWDNISLGNGSVIKLSSATYAIYTSYYSEYYQTDFDIRQLIVEDSPFYWGEYEPEDSSQTIYSVLENGIPVKEITFVGRSETIKDTEHENTADIAMTGSVDKAGEESIVYSVDVSWGNMEFTYNDKKQGTWNPTTHHYDGAKEAGWSCDEGANKVTVTNHSNADVNVSFGYAPNNNYNISGSFDKKGTTTLSKGIVNDFNNADSITASLTLDDYAALSPSAASDTVIGTVTVKITEPIV